ncbi:MAG: hypothetical protein AB7P02_09940 [Alphaproteobacteria bacterium]
MNGLRRTLPITAAAAALLVLAACGSDPKEEASRTTTYRCALGRVFTVTVRPGMDRVAVAVDRQRWLLPKAEGEGAAEGHYALGARTLQVTGEEASLAGFSGGPYQGCRAEGPPVVTKPGAPPLPVE